MAHQSDSNGYSLVAPPSESNLEDNTGEDELIPVHVASLAEKKRLWWRNAVINVGFIASWFAFAIVLSVYNKWMFSPEQFGFPSPLFVTTLHMAVQFTLAALLRVMWPRHFRPAHSPSRTDYLYKAVPTGVSTGFDIGLSNLSLKLITLSFYTMCKSSSLIFVLMFAFLFRLETFSLRLVGVIVLIVIGVLLMVATQAHFDLTGFLLVMGGSALGGFRWSLTQLLLRNKKMGFNNPAATLFWLAPIMGVSLAITTLLVDGWAKVFNNHFFDGEELLETCFFLISPGIIAFCMVLSEFYILQRAGVVPMSIAGIAKEVSTITVSAWFFGDELTPLNITGVAITVCGIALYTYHKYRKSIDSNVPLDAHGIPIEDDDMLDDSVALQGGLSDETQRLNPDADPRSSHDSHTGHMPPDDLTGEPEELLFDVGSDEDAEHTDYGAGASRSATSDPPPYTVDEVPRAWKEDLRIS
ncbi:uncharacterized protein FIBRA_01871 [Fibroporia radiculosa]|uniref:Sugar phosphate transporter domain-containing protein n=1 Tax=Fibroporia radiculosa TaxID=599839 RepID=J4HU07_9APHY|nr:uncharacterized protein FIBRA_01871 [Fibroporia radiculosa]CCL99847.1 predicted protein [Fibroporia radiculosa]